jgi:hypothetical protein
MTAALMERFGGRRANVTGNARSGRPLTVMCVEVKIGSILVSGTTYEVGSDEIASNMFSTSIA